MARFFSPLLDCGVDAFRLLVVFLSSFLSIFEGPVTLEGPATSEGPATFEGFATFGGATMKKNVST